MIPLIASVVATVLCAFAGWRGSVWVLPQARNRLERVLAAATLALAFATLAALLLAELGVFSAKTILVTLAAGAGAAWLLSRRRKADTEATPPSSWTAVTVLPLALAAVAVIVAGLAAWYVPVWQWDSLGYHLPFVNFVLQRGARADVPALIPYISTYPHGIEYLFLIFRSFLPDDRWIDCGQIPLGIVGAVAVAGIAERLGGRREHVLAAGALWLTLPAVFLQLPTNYVDVGAAMYFLLATYWLLPRADRSNLGRLILAAVALGLYLGAKPSAPLPTVILAVVVAVKIKQAGGFVWVAAAAGIVTMVGGESYLRNLIATGNPVWPITVNLGPLHLPGVRTVAKLVAAGAASPRPHGGFWTRLLTSWATWRGPPAFDMRLGGLGPVFLLFAVPGLALFVYRCWRQRELRVAALLLVIMVAALAHPEPSTARFVLAFPALCLAAAVAALAQLPRKSAAVCLAAATAAGTWALWHAYPGLTIGGDLSLVQIAQLPPSQRRTVIGADGSPERWLRWTDALSAGDVVAYDESFTLPGLLWNTRLANTVVALPWQLDETGLKRALVSHQVNYLVAGDDQVAGELVRRLPQHFERLFACGSDPCQVYRVVNPLVP